MNIIMKHNRIHSTVCNICHWLYELRNTASFDTKTIKCIKLNQASNYVYGTTYTDRVKVEHSLGFGM